MKTDMPPKRAHMGPAEDARAKFWDPAIGSLDISTAEKAASVWRTAAEAGKLECEAERLQLEAATIRRAASSEARRFWISVLAPLISALAVVAALWVQMYQINRNSSLQRESNDATSFREAIKMVTASDQGARVGGAMFLTVLLHSDTYGATARQISVSILSQPLDPESFQLVLRPFVEATNWGNIVDLVRVSENLEKTDTQLRDQRKALSHNRVSAKPTDNINGKSSSSPLRMEEVAKDLNLVDEEQKSVAQALTRFVKQKRLSSQNLNLSGAYFWGSQLKDADLHSTVLTGVSFLSCDVTNADFSNVEQYENSLWIGTVWWHAGKMSPQLLNYLKTQYPYSADSTYDGEAEATSSKDYAVGIMRLQSETIGK